MKNPLDFPTTLAIDDSHNFLKDDAKIAKNAKRTFYVVVLTTIMMVVEIVSGYLTGSMALLADGWHMASHAGALSISLVAYRLAQSAQMNAKFSFGAGKFIPLGGYTSAIVLALIALLMAFESTLRFFSPQVIQFNEAIIVAILGLVVNVVSAFMLSGDHHDHGHQAHGDDHHNHGHQAHGDDHHNHGHEQHHGHGHHHDHNLRSAYIHVIADALTSVFAIIALTVGMLFGAVWLDPMMGIVGSMVILKWAYNLCKETGWELLDGRSRTIPDDKIKKIIEGTGAAVVDLHIWRIAPSAMACEVSLTAKELKGAPFYVDLIKALPAIKHIIVEENQS